MAKQGAFFFGEDDVVEKPKRSQVPRTGKPRPDNSAIFDCDKCGLCEGKQCTNPKLPVYGDNHKDILVVGSYPTKRDDEYGVPFSGNEGQMLKKFFSLAGMSLLKDCSRIHAVRCYPGAKQVGKWWKPLPPSKTQIKCCKNKLVEDIERLKPKLIICLGSEAIQMVLETETMNAFSVDQVHGKTFPSHKYGCWVGAIHTPKFYLDRKRRVALDPDDEALFGIDLKSILTYLDKELPMPLTDDGNEFIHDSTEAIEILEYYATLKTPVAIDYEATCLDSHKADARVLNITLSSDVRNSVFIPLELINQDTKKPWFNLVEQAHVFHALNMFLQSETPKVVQNHCMEELWSRNKVGSPMNNCIHDTMNGYHVINCRPGTTGLAFQTYENTGHEYKSIIKDYSKIEETPIKELVTYGCWDARYTLMAYQRQIAYLNRPGNERLKAFNDFYTLSGKTMSNIQDTGIQVDLERLHTILNKYKDEKQSCIDTATNLPGVQEYVQQQREAKGPKASGFNIESTSQLGKIMYDVYKVKAPANALTPSGKGSTSKEVLPLIAAATKNKDVVKLIDSVQRFRLVKQIVDRAEEYLRLVDPDGLVHPSFNLNIARSFRSSANGPNIQNVFKHNEEQKKFRRCIVPRAGRIILEGDYGSLEVGITAMISGDPELERQIKARIDPHAKWACLLHQMTKEELAKTKFRSRAKNGFVFPCFYGSVEDTIVREYSDLDEGHVRKIYQQFWGEYHYVKEWQKKTISDYLTHGYVELATGARRPGPLSINKLYNTPIQGPAYHIMQMSLNKIDRFLLECGFETKIVGEIHDAILLDTVLDEAEDVLAAATAIMQEKHFEWQRDVPIFVDWEVGEDNWYDIEKLV